METLAWAWQQITPLTSHSSRQDFHTFLDVSRGTFIPTCTLENCSWLLWEPTCTLGNLVKQFPFLVTPNITPSYQQAASEAFNSQLTVPGLAVSVTSEALRAPCAWRWQPGLAEHPWSPARSRPSQRRTHACFVPALCRFAGVRSTPWMVLTDGELGFVFTNTIPV